MPHPQNPFSYVKTRSLLLWVVLSGMIAALLNLPLQQITRLNPKDPSWTMINYIIVMILTSGLIWWRINSVGGTFRDIFGKLPRSTHWLRLAGLTFATLLVSLGSFFVFAYLLYLSYPDFLTSLIKAVNSSALQTPSTSVATKVLTWFTVVIVAPITEELLFRGVLLQRWGSRWGIRAGLILSSIVFGFLHVNPIGLSIFGLLMGTLYIRTGSLSIVIACHAFNNFLASLGMFVPDQSSKSSQLNLESIPAMGGTGLVLLLIGAPWLIRYLMQNFPDRSTLLPYWHNQNISQNTSRP
jgi:uncharacterized protein